MLHTNAWSTIPATTHLSSSSSTSAIDSRRMEVAESCLPMMPAESLPMRMIRRSFAKAENYTIKLYFSVEAHWKDIDKLWIGIDKFGKELVDEKRMMHSTIWKLVEVSRSTTSCGRAPTTCTIGGR
ncbi:hypothetical protein PENTCL1PPCAC_5206, partial [Pristionchus entomophagus]